MIKIIPQFLSIVFISALSGSSLATTETADINLSFTHTNYVNLTGTVVGASRFFSAVDISDPQTPVTLGTLGLESNMSGNCSMIFSTKNTFQLEHIVTSKVLAKYRLWYRGQEITLNTNEVLSACNISATPLEFSTTKRLKGKGKVKQGIYQDIVTVTVTTQ